MPRLISTFGSNLRQQRKLRGWTQARLAEAANLSLDMIGRLKRGRVAPSFESIEVLATVLEVSPAAFFGGSSDSPASGERARALQRIHQHLARANDTELRKLERLVAVFLDRT